MALALGRTVGELQKSMTVNEVILWSSYLAKHGTLSPQRKYDMGAAMICSTISRANGGKAKPMEFMPFAKPSEAVDDQIKEIFGSVKIGSRRKHIR